MAAGRNIVAAHSLRGTKLQAETSLEALAEAIESLRVDAKRGEVAVQRAAAIFDGGRHGDRSTDHIKGATNGTKTALALYGHEKLSFFVPLKYEG
jgi:hypothetical protein